MQTTKNSALNFVKQICPCIYLYLHMYCKKLLLTKCIDLRQESLILLMFTVLLSFFKIKKINKIFLNTFLNIWNNLIKKIVLQHKQKTLN